MDKVFQLKGRLYREHRGPNKLELSVKPFTSCDRASTEGATVTGRMRYQGVSKGPLQVVVTCQISVQGLKDFVRHLRRLRMV